MNWNTIINFFDSNLIQTIAIAIVGFFAYKISKLQTEEAHTVELHAYYALENGQPFVRLQNVGTRIIYLDYYLFNGSKYHTNKRVLPSVYSQAFANFYWIKLPTNGVSHVSIIVSFSGFRGKTYESEIVANLVNGYWDVITYPSKKKGL